MLVSIPPKVVVSSFMGYLKGKSSLMIYEQYGNLKYKYEGRKFWCRGLYVQKLHGFDVFPRAYDRICRMLMESLFRFVLRLKDAVGLVALLLIAFSLIC